MFTHSLDPLRALPLTIEVNSHCMQASAYQGSQDVISAPSDLYHMPMTSDLAARVPCFNVYFKAPPSPPPVQFRQPPCFQIHQTLTYRGTVLTFVNKHLIDKMSSDNSSTLKSYVDSATGAVQSGIASITGSAGDKVLLSDIFASSDLTPHFLPLPFCDPYRSPAVHEPY